MAKTTVTAELYQKLSDRVGKVILGKEDTVRNVICALFSGGHILPEDVPGTGKTSLVRALASAFGGTCKRVQFTPDLLPSRCNRHSLLSAGNRGISLAPGTCFHQFVPCG